MGPEKGLHADCLLGQIPTNQADNLHFIEIERHNKYKVGDMCNCGTIIEGNGDGYRCIIERCQYFVICVDLGREIHTKSGNMRVFNRKELKPTGAGCTEKQGLDDMRTTSEQKKTTKRGYSSHLAWVTSVVLSFSLILSNFGAAGVVREPNRSSSFSVRPLPVFVT